VVSWAVATAAILGIAIVIAPTEGSSNFYWNRVFWTEILNAIFWFGKGGVLSIGSRTRIAALIPALCIVISTYCVISFCLMLIAALFQDISLISRYHLALQISLFAITTLISLVMLIAQNQALSGTVIPGNAFRSPLDLCDMLALIENNDSKPTVSPSITELSKHVKMLRENIRYSLQNNPKTRVHSDYGVFVKDIEELCASIDINMQHSDITTEALNALSSKIIQMKNRVDFLSSVIARS